MIALDSSAVIAIARREPEAERFAEVIAATSKLLIGAPTLLEIRMVVAGRLGTDGITEPLSLILPRSAQVIAFDETHLAAAVAAFDRYGKGCHPASLNFGDCMAYAIAKVAGCALLYKGDDFARTDIRSAL